jgi:hypothetical protein
MGIIGFSAAANNTYDHPLFNNSMASRLDTGDQQQGGDDLAQPVLAAHHFAGTAQFGKVAVHRFRVYGTEGLYCTWPMRLSFRSRLP